MRTNRYSLAVLGAMAVFGYALPAQAQYGTGQTIAVPRATGTITLDGNANEAAWASAATVDLVANWNGGYYDNGIDGGTWGDPEVPDVAVTGKLLWQDGALYIHVNFEDYQTLFFGDGTPYNGEQILIGVDLTHQGDDQIDDGYGGWVDNAPNLGPTTYKISAADGVGITSNWFFDGVAPVDSGWVAGQTFVDNANFTWGVEMAIYGTEIMNGADIGFNAGGGTADERMLADTTVGGDAVYGYFSWGASDPPGSAGGDVMHNSASFGTLHLQEVVANEPGAGARDFALRPNQPNPFTGSTRLTYDMARSGQVELAAFDVLGRQVAVIDAGARAAGTYGAQFNASDLAPGVYTVRLVVDGAVVATQRVLQTR